MLIKVRDNFYLNSDRIDSIAFYESEQEYISLYQRGTDLFNGPCAIVVSGACAYQISQDAARYVLAMMEVKDALITDSAPAQVNLKSRIAVLLRDTWQGPSLTFLHAVLEDEISEIETALEALIAEQVVIAIPEGDCAELAYYHKSSATAQDYLRSKRCVVCGSSRAMHFDTTNESVRGHFFTPNPDPSNASATRPDASEIPAGRSEQKVDPKSDD